MTTKHDFNLKIVNFGIFSFISQKKREKRVIVSKKINIFAHDFERGFKM